METVTARIPEEQKKLLDKIGDEEGLAQSEVLRKIISKGTDDWRRERAIKMLEDGSITLRKAADFAGTSYLEMLELASDKGIETGYDLEEFEKDMEWL
ncbi:MAG: UPF0175 family protein [Candidatus Nanohaloarchaea archaeon]